MPNRAVPVVLATLIVASAIAWRVAPASSGAARSGPLVVAPVVALRHHDQQGIALAHQAEAQSPSASTRRRAATLASAFTDQARALTAVLDARGVGFARRTVDTTRLGVEDAGAVGCDLMPKDAVSGLAASPSSRFDATFTRLMGRHLVGGVRMSATVLASGLRAPERTAVRAAQAGLT